LEPAFLFQGLQGGKENQPDEDAEKDTPEFPADGQPGLVKIVTGSVCAAFIVDLLRYKRS
jgi:hypothetical protein